MKHELEVQTQIERDFANFTQFLISLLDAREGANQKTLKIAPEAGSLYHVLEVQIQKSEGLKLREVTKLRDALIEKGHFQELLEAPQDDLATLEEKAFRYLRSAHDCLREEIRKRREQ